MGEVTSVVTGEVTGPVRDWRDDRAAVVGYLCRVNGTASAARVALYADAFLEYRLAQANIREHGPVVLHPRTGAPIDNPLLKVRDRARAALQKQHMRSDELWA
jgi:phage terminase small subunit